jgi:diguanylate cyclase (GGDEF)-like protein
MLLEFPGSPVPIDSPFYIERSPVETMAYTEITKPGSLLRIKAPCKTGKTSLMLRLINYGKVQGYATVIINFDQAEKEIFVSLDKFLRWFCANVSMQLELPLKLDDYWDEDFGSKISATLYWQGYLLEQIKKPILLCLNRVHHVFEYPNIAQDFLPLLRSWHEEGKHLDQWLKLRLVVIHSTEIYIPLNLHQSPFNVGLPLKLPPFNFEQVQELALKHNFLWATEDKGKQELQLLLEMVGGQPYLIRLAFYAIANHQISLAELLREAPTINGIYKDHLRSLLDTLKQHPALEIAFQKIITTNLDQHNLDAITAYQLENMGLIEIKGDHVQPSCMLYRLYFQNQLPKNNYLVERLKELEQENQELHRLCYIDDLTQIANQRYFSHYLEKTYELAAQQFAYLSIILGDVDFFALYNKYYGKDEGNICLKKVAQTMMNLVEQPCDLVARFSNDRFIILLLEKPPVIAVQLAETIRKEIEGLAIPQDPKRIGLPSSYVTMSFGVVSVIPELTKKPETLLEMAETALLKAKHKGKNIVSLV